jgi:hypothetical protein
MVYLGNEKSPRRANGRGLADTAMGGASVLSVTPDELARFWSKVDKSPHPKGCWLWMAGMFKTGYGGFYFRGQMVRAHRFSCELAHGPIPDGLMALHTCDTYPCVNPAHLYAGTRERNTADAIERGRFASGDRNGSRTRPDRYGRGEDKILAKLTEQAVTEIRARYESGGISQQRLAAEFGVSQGLVSRIVRRAGWQHVA